MEITMHHGVVARFEIQILAYQSTSLITDFRGFLQFLQANWQDSALNQAHNHFFTHNQQFTIR
jgi:hypothetical protein